MTLGNMSRSLSHTCSAFVSFLMNVTVFLTKQFFRLNYCHTSETHSVLNTRAKSMYSLIAVLRTKFDNIFQFTSNEFFAYVSKRRKRTCVPHFWDIWYSIKPFDILPLNQICQPQVSILYKILLHIENVL